MATVIGIAGALRRASYNAALLRAAVALAPPGLTIEVASIRDFPLYDGDQPPGAGFHLALSAPDRQAVNEFHATALSFGARDEGAPGLRSRYGPGYYAAFVRDPDGHKLEAVFHEK
jgi:NAD(P)H-dependent FMN reductase